VCLCALGLVPPTPARAGPLILLATFNGGTAGGDPSGSLAIDGRGNLYGTAFFGGAFGLGTVWELPHGSHTLTALASFNGANGELPLQNGVIIDGRGNLFGTAQFGGSLGFGTVWELAHGSHTITTLASFNAANGAFPASSPLLMDSHGNFFGTTQSGALGNGVVFELPHGSHTISALAVFNGTNGTRPVGGLIMDSQGNLFGTAQGGGPSNQGVVFELPRGSHTLNVLASFNGPNGASSQGSLIMDGRGNLFGTTQFGGAFQQGVLFELPHGSHTIIPVANFNGPTGIYPFVGLIMDARGNLFGTANEGGNPIFRAGTVFELPQGSHTIIPLGDFNFTNGAFPLAPLVTDGRGNVFTTGGVGGAFGDGTVVELPGVVATAAPVPEPSTLLLAGSALLLLGGASRCRRGRGTPTKSSPTATAAG
jgi:uncharacterized repeat protein (TIGR03803 family)